LWSVPRTLNAEKKVWNKPRGAPRPFPLSNNAQIVVLNMRGYRWLCRISDLRIWRTWNQILREVSKSDGLWFTSYCSDYLDSWHNTSYQHNWLCPWMPMNSRFKAFQLHNVKICDQTSLILYNSACWNRGE
jgi:hypothetical protein